jgi:hypothetical protein
VIDRGNRLFDRLRSKIVLSCASDAFFEVYNDLTFAHQDVYRAGSKIFRSSLFPFEERTISQHFPSPPGTVLIGAAGGGREAFALARRGYQVVAFEPARALAASIASTRGELKIEAFIGRYEDLPVVNTLSKQPIAIDLRLRAPFEAAIMGWGSLSLLRSEQRCIETLRQFGGLTTGPILVSCIASPFARSAFSPTIGYYRGFSGEELQGIAERAGLEVIHLDAEGISPGLGEGIPHAVFRASATPR